MKRKTIAITFNSKPDVPEGICHTFPVMELTKVKTRRFELSQWREAWAFMTECTSPITNLRQLIYAMPRKLGKKVLDLLEENTLINNKGKWLNIKEEENTEFLRYDSISHLLD